MPDPSEKMCSHVSAGGVQIEIRPARMRRRLSRLAVPWEPPVIASEQMRSLAGPAARNVMSRKTVMSARSSAMAWFGASANRGLFCLPLEDHHIVAILAFDVGQLLLSHDAKGND